MTIREGDPLPSETSRILGEDGSPNPGSTDEFFEDGIVTRLHVEPEGSFGASGAEAMPALL